MWHLVATAVWILSIFTDICQPQWELRPQLHRRPKKIYPNATIITASPSTKTYYNPNPGYDAYWTDGHWIFGTTTTKPTFSTSTRTRPMVCRKPCDIEYRYVGPVCAQMVNNTDFRYTAPPIMPRWAEPIVTDPNYPMFTTFSTYCEFLNHQCNETVWNYMSWVFVHFGSCLTDTTIYLPVENDIEIYDRLYYNLDQYKRHLNQSLDDPSIGASENMTYEGKNHRKISQEQPFRKVYYNKSSGCPIFLKNIYVGPVTGPR